LARVELHVHPPLSYNMTSSKVGAFVLEQEIDQGETLGDLLTRLEDGDHQAWQGTVDAGTHEIRTAVITILNGTLLLRSEAPRTPLSDGDQIAFRIGYSGG
jgi:hypothetical protein